MGSDLQPIFHAQTYDLGLLVIFVKCLKTLPFQVLNLLFELLQWSKIRPQYKSWYKENSHPE